MPSPVAVAAALAERGAPRIILSTAKRNEAAQRLFARHGFRPTMIEMTREPSPASAGSRGQAIDAYTDR
jgi:RimJ/RimL family protein N-acetyltransferase